jgi:hypothetical protein
MSEDLVRYHVQQHIELLRFFTWEHLPADLQAVSRPCGDLAEHMARELPVCAETTAGLRKLLEAKDCFVRAALVKKEYETAPPRTDHGV